MRRFLLLTVFAVGMTTLAAELAASRLIGNVFGTSNIVWAAIIGLILIYLAAGYALGGRWADRHPTHAEMYRLAAWGAFSLGTVPYAASIVLQRAATAFDNLQVSILAGAFLAVLVLFSVPITLLGMISPFAIRLSVMNSAEAGSVAGRIYAVSTAGSFIGTFLPVLVTIPTLGTRLTFLMFSLLLLAVALTGLVLSVGPRRAAPYALMPVVLIALAAGVGRASLKSSAGQILEAESAYNYIQVQQAGEYTLLRLNEGQGVHSIYSPRTLEYGGPWQQFLVAPFFYEGRQPSEVRHMAIIGLAAGTAARQAGAAFADVQIDGYELDGRIVDIGMEYFGLRLPNLSVRIGDGRLNLERVGQTYDLIAVDAYRPPYIPPHLTTQEFFQIAYDHLAQDGALAINAAGIPDDRRLVNGLATTISTVFPSVYVADVPNSLNTMIFATRQPTSPAFLTRNLERLSATEGVHPVLLSALRTASAYLRPGFETTEVFTDDRAPIERIVNDMVIDFVLSGGLEYLE